MPVNTEYSTNPSSFGRNAFGTTLYGDPEKITVTGTPGDVAMLVEGDLEVEGDIIGDITGDITGNVTGDVTGNVTGDLTGNVTGDVTGDLTGTASIAASVPVVAFASLPAATAGGVLFCSDAAPDPALCFADGTNWIDVLTGAPVTD